MWSERKASTELSEARIKSEDKQQLETEMTIHTGPHTGHGSASDLPRMVQKYEQIKCCKKYDRRRDFQQDGVVNYRWKIQQSNGANHAETMSQMATHDNGFHQLTVELSEWVSRFLTDPHGPCLNTHKLYNKAETRHLPVIYMYKHK